MILSLVLEADVYTKSRSISGISERISRRFVRNIFILFFF